MRHLSVFAVLTAALACATPARAADSQANCTGYIDALPAYVGDSGTWCLRKDLSLSLASGEAIIAGDDNVVIDCNGFRVMNTAADNAAVGIATTMNSVSVRRCVVRGFRSGVDLHGSAPLVEDSRIENSVEGIILMDVDAWGESGVAIARRNQVIDSEWGGIVSMGRTVIEDNLIDGVGGGMDPPYGIAASGEAAVVSRNIVRGLIDPNSEGTGIEFSNFRGAARDNVVIALPGNGGGIGIRCVDQTTHGNLVSGFADPLLFCDASLDDAILP